MRREAASGTARNDTTAPCVRVGEHETGQVSGHGCDGWMDRPETYTNARIPGNSSL
jgi:hypothetical protein